MAKISTLQHIYIYSYLSLFRVLSFLFSHSLYNIHTYIYAVYIFLSLSLYLSRSFSLSLSYFLFFFFLSLSLSLCSALLCSALLCSALLCSALSLSLSLSRYLVLCSRLCPALFFCSSLSLSLSLCLSLSLSLSPLPFALFFCISLISLPHLMLTFLSLFVAFCPLSPPYFALWIAWIGPAQEIDYDNRRLSAPLGSWRQVDHPLQPPSSIDTERTGSASVSKKQPKQEVIGRMFLDVLRLVLQSSCPPTERRNRRGL